METSRPLYKLVELCILAKFYEIGWHFGRAAGEGGAAVKPHSQLLMV